jgi:exopolyphosphatase/guanosine-5'-triphosphate,3'-diphosphate pyrophosphatase
MIAAAIDVGTNSIKLVVGEKDARGAVRLLCEAVIITRLGEKLDSTGVISDAAFRQTLEGLRGLVRDARDLGAESIRAVATSAMRDAANRDEFINAVEAETGVHIQVISGEEEARFTRSAVVLDPVLGQYDGDIVTVDVGGGSTEVTTARDALSVDIGAVRLHERFIRHDPPWAAEVESAAKCAEDTLRSAISVRRDAQVVGMGGSAVNLARMLKAVACEDFAQVHGVAVTACEIAGLIGRLAEMTVEQRRAMVGLDPERADVILAGAIILGAVLKVLGRDEMLVSVRGLRHGLLYVMLT